jgi:hypothetical protein
MRKLAVLLIAVLALRVAPAAAAEAEPLVVNLDKAHMMRLAKPAHRVVVGNPAIADVTLETPVLMSIFGKTAGETSLLILGDDDREILSQPIVVTTTTDRTVSVHLPGSDGPGSREYSCLANRCLRVPAPGYAASGAQTAAPGSTPGSALTVPPAIAPNISAPTASASPAPDITSPVPVGTVLPMR